MNSSRTVSIASVFLAFVFLAFVSTGLPSAALEESPGIPGTAPPAIEAPVLPGSPRELYDVANLPRLREWRTYQASGYDRGDGFYDSGNFESVTSEGAWVLAAIEGPGCISRLWTTAKRALDIDIIFECDGRPGLRVDRESLFPSSAASPPGHPDFPFPIAGRSTPLAAYSYAPIVFERRCRILFEPRRPIGEESLRENSRGEKIPHVYYQVGYRRFPEGTRLASAPSDAAEALGPGRDLHAKELHEAAEVWTRCLVGADEADGSFALVPLPGELRGEAREGSVELPPGASATLLLLRGPAVLTGIRLDLPGHPAADRASIRLRLEADGASPPDVDASIDGYFARGFSTDPVRSLLAGGRGSEFVSRVPAPFRRSMQISLSNGSRAPRVARWRIEFRPLPEWPEDFAYLHAKDFAAEGAPEGQDLLLLEREGRGHLVGCVLVDVGDMEGDERISVDGGPVSEYHGTGTEDFLNFAWGLGYKASFPLHGLNAEADSRGRHANGYRFFLPDCVPFRRKIRFTLEHGHGNRHAGLWRGSVLWYEARSPAYGSP